jgi:hypothetical protein
VPTEQGACGKLQCWEQRRQESSKVALVPYKDRKRVLGHKEPEEGSYMGKGGKRGKRRGKCRGGGKDTQSGRGQPGRSDQRSAAAP